MLGPEVLGNTTTIPLDLTMVQNVLEALRLVQEKTALRLTQVNRFPDGITNSTYHVKTDEGREFVLKLGRCGPERKLHREAVALQLLSGFLPVPSALWESQENIPYCCSGIILMEYFPFKPAKPLLANLPVTFFQESAEILARLHSHSRETQAACRHLAKLYRNAPTNITPNPFVTKCARAFVLVQRISDYSTEFAPLVHEIWARMDHDKGYFVPDTLALTHGDLSMTNVLTDGTSCKAIIDWEDVQIGDAGCDLHFFCQSALEWGAHTSMVRLLQTEYGRRRSLPMNFAQADGFYRYTEAHK